MNSFCPISHCKNSIVKKKEMHAASVESNRSNLEPNECSPSPLQYFRIQSINQLYNSMPKNNHLLLIAIVLPCDHISRVTSSNPTHRRLFINALLSPSIMSRSMQITSCSHSNAVLDNSMSAMSACFKSFPTTSASKKVKRHLSLPSPATNPRKEAPPTRTHGTHRTIKLGLRM